MVQNCHKVVSHQINQMQYIGPCLDSDYYKLTHRKKKHIWISDRIKELMDVILWLFYRQTK